MQARQQHRQELQRFLQKQFAVSNWNFTLPRGSGAETYFAHGGGNSYFVKVGAKVENYVAMADIGLTPHVVAVGELEGGTSVIVQPYVEGGKPSRRDYHTHLEQVATIIRDMHHSPRVRHILPTASTDLYKVIGYQSLVSVRQRWERYKTQAPSVARFVDESLEYLAHQVERFSGAGLVASHNDIGNANWLFTPTGKIYLIDLELMSFDDPACDVGAILWWYYPPRLRQQFLAIAEYVDDPSFQLRMRVQMAIHCLSILLPREQGFDSFVASSFNEALSDFRAALEGQENPEGYED